MNYQNAWVGGAQFPAPGGLMSPIHPWGLGAMATNGGETAPNMGSAVNPARPGGEGTSSGYSVPGDKATATQTSQASKDRVLGSLKGSIGTNLAATGLKAGAAYALGMPGSMIGPAAIGSLAGPASIGNVLGGALNAAMGTKPQGFLEKAIAYGAPVLGGVLGGPMGGLLGGMMGGPIASGVMDAFDARKNEAVRDAVEDNRGEIAGRPAVADMQGFMDRVNEIQSKMAPTIDRVNTIRGFTGAAPVGYGGTRMSLDTMAPGGYGLGGTGSSNTRNGWGGYDPGHASPGFGIANRSAEIARGALDGIDWGGFSVGGRGGDGGRDNGGFGANDGNSDTAGNAGFGR